jgi:hypothetical protein
MNVEDFVIVFLVKFDIFSQSHGNGMEKLRLGHET